MYCIDLIITDQPNMFTESGIHSFGGHYQHQIVCPPPYHRTLWDYAICNDNEIKASITSIDWSALINALDANQMAICYCSRLYS